jgi:hypothetical protein
VFGEGISGQSDHNVSYCRKNLHGRRPLLDESPVSLMEFAGALAGLTQDYEFHRLKAVHVVIQTACVRKNNGSFLYIYFEV